MRSYENELKMEKEYFNRTMSEIQLQLSEKLMDSKGSRDDIIFSRREMWEDIGQSVGDIAELAQYMDNLNIQTSLYYAGKEQIQKLKNLKSSPYFARIDFREDGYRDIEKIYIGIYTLIDDNHEILIYDWRSLIASVFYRFELGDVYYNAPDGKISGEVSLKRQYEIRKGNFEYFFDANIQIVDEFLRKLLSKNASTKWLILWKQFRESRT